MPAPNNSYEFDLMPFRPVDSHVTNSTISSATILTPPASADRILIQALGANVRFTLDSTLPTASIGFQLRAEDPPVLIPVTGMIDLTVIQESSGAIIQYQWGN